MKYHAIGKEYWDTLPTMFTDNETAEMLTQDDKFWAYTYMFPHKYRLDADGNPLTCVMEAWITFSKSDGMFKKVLRPIS